MNRHILAFIFIVSAGCSSPMPAPEAMVEPPSKTSNSTNALPKNTTKNLSSITVPPTSSAGPISAQNQIPTHQTSQKNIPLSYHAISSQGLTISVVYYDDREFQLQVADQPKGCGSLWLDAKSAGLSRNAVAAINAGFFTPEGKPLGLVVESGIKRGHLNQSSLGTGLYCTTASGSTITRRDNSRTSEFINSATHLLQAGPILIENGLPSYGLSALRNRPRSFLAWDGHHHWMIGHITTATLSGAAQALANSPSLKFKPAIALNLDGGRSSDLWAGPLVSNGNKTHRSFLNKVVRNYLVLTPR